MEHIPEYCDVKHCTNEASRWIDTAPLSGDFDVKMHTFFLCLDHTLKLSLEDSMYSYLNPETHVIRELEIASYCCNDACDVCNDSRS